MDIEMMKITVYLNESDRWQNRPLHLEILRMLYENNLSGGTVIPAIAGFTNEGIVEKTSWNEKPGKLPLVVEFIDTIQKIQNILPELKRMVGNRLISRELIEVIN